MYSVQNIYSFNNIYPLCKNKNIYLIEYKVLPITRYITILYNKEKRIIPVELCHNAKMQSITDILIFQR